MSGLCMRDTAQYLERLRKLDVVIVHCGGNNVSFHPKKSNVVQDFPAHLSKSFKSFADGLGHGTKLKIMQIITRSNYLRLKVRTSVWKNVSGAASFSPTELEFANATHQAKVGGHFERSFRSDNLIKNRLKPKFFKQFLGLRKIKLLEYYSSFTVFFVHFEIFSKISFRKGNSLLYGQGGIFGAVWGTQSYKIFGKLFRMILLFRSDITKWAHLVELTLYFLFKLETISPQTFPYRNSL